MAAAGLVPLLDGGSFAVGSARRRQLVAVCVVMLWASCWLHGGPPVRSRCSAVVVAARATTLWPRSRKPNLLAPALSFDVFCRAVVILLLQREPVRLGVAVWRGTYTVLTGA